MIGQPYVNYENCGSWKLTDGSPMPNKKYFENWSFDQETRTFKGELNWSEKNFNKCNKTTHICLFDE